MFVSDWGVIHFVIIYIGKHSMEKLTGANVPHYAFLYTFQFLTCALHRLNTCLCTKIAQNNSISYVFNFPAYISRVET